MPDFYDFEKEFGTSSFQESRENAFKNLTDKVKASKFGEPVSTNNEVDQDYQDFLQNKGKYEKIDLTKPLNMDNKYHREYQREQNIEDRTEFTRGLLSGIDETQGMLYGAAGMVGSLTKIDSLRDWGFKNYKKNLEEAELNPISINKIEDIDGISDLGDWFAGTLGKLAPTIGEIAISAGIGAFMGSAATPAGTAVGGVAGAFNRGMIKAVLRKKLEYHLGTTVLKTLAKKEGMAVAKRAAKKRVGADLGRDIGVLIGSSALESGGMWTEESEKYGVENANAWSSLGLGIISGATELVSPSGMFIRKSLGLKQAAKGLNKAEALKILKNAGTKRFVGSLLKAMPVSGVKEGVQEVVQDIISTLNAFINDPNMTASDLLSAENLSNYANAFAGGAAAGILFGGVSGTTGYHGEKRSARDFLTKDHQENEAIAGTVIEDFTSSGIQDEIITENPDIPTGYEESEVEEIIKVAQENAIAETGGFQEFSEAEEFAMKVANIQKKLDTLLNKKKPNDKQKKNIAKYKKEIGNLLETEQDIKKEEATPATEYKGTEQFTQNFLDMGMDKNQAKASSQSLVRSFTDPEEAKAILHPSRKLEREIWQKETGIILPDDIKGTKETIDKHLAPSKIETTDQAKLVKKLEDKASEDELKGKATEEIKDIQSPEQKLEDVEADRVIREQDEQEAIRQEALNTENVTEKEPQDTSKIDAIDKTSPENVVENDGQNDTKNVTVDQKDSVKPSEQEISEQPDITTLPESPSKNQEAKRLADISESPIKKGDLVSWKTKTGKEFSGKLIKKNKKHWVVKGDNGENIWVLERDLIPSKVEKVENGRGQLTPLNPREFKGSPAISNAITRINETDDLGKNLQDIYRIKKRLSQKSTQDSISDETNTRLNSEVQQVEQNLKKEGYEIVDLMGKEYVEGMTVKARFIVDPKEDLHDNEDLTKEVITKVIKPQINKDGKLNKLSDVEIMIRNATLKEIKETLRVLKKEQKFHEEFKDKPDADLSKRITALEAFLENQEEISDQARLETVPATPVEVEQAEPAKTTDKESLKQPWETSDLATAPNIADSSVKARKLPNGKYILEFIGTSNEVFKGEIFRSAKEARMFFKVQKLKAQNAATVETKPSQEKPTSKESLQVETKPEETTERKRTETKPKKSGIKYTPEYLVEETGETFTGKTQDAAVVRWEIEQKQDTYKKLRDCLSI